MEAIGQLLEPITGELYTWRIPIAVASIALAILLAVVAIRRGWLEQARRHPVASGLLALAVLAVAVPVTWYLASPIFLRTSLVEAAPTVSFVPADPPPTPTTAPTPSRALPSPDPTASPTEPPTPTPFVPVAVAVGSFTGTDDFHFGRGTATLLEIEPGRYHLRLDDFSVRNGPDLFVYLSTAPDRWTKRSFEVGRLKATDGAFGYDLPEGFDPKGFESAIIWCKQFRHLFATAPFES